MDESRAAKAARAEADEDATERRYQVERERLSVAIGRRISAFRVRQQLSQEELAFRVNLGRTYLGLVERGRVNISAFNLLRIAVGLNADISALIPTPEELDLNLPGQDPSVPRLKPGRKSAVAAGEDEQPEQHRADAGRDDQTSGSQSEPKSASSHVSSSEAEGANQDAALVTPEWAAKRLGLSRRTIARWVKNGRLSAEHVENSQGNLTIVFQKSEVLRVAASLPQKGLT